MTIPVQNLKLSDCVCADAERLAIFQTLVGEYCEHLSEALQTLELPVCHHDLLRIVQTGHKRYGLRCHLIEHVVQLANDSALTAEDAVQVMIKAAYILPYLFEKTAAAREKVNSVRFWLNLRDLDYPSLVSIAHDANWSEGRPKDRLTWHYVRTKGPSLTLSCDPMTLRGKTSPLLNSLIAPPQMVLTQSQAKAAEQLAAHYRLHQQGASLSGYSIRPPLLVGRSGVGKTAVARHMAKILGRPLFAYDMGAWAPQGSKVEVSTFEAIRRALRQHESGILLYIDEVDKFTGREQSWYASLNQEIYSLIDGRTDGYSGWDAADRLRLAKSFIFAGGTFQHLFKREKRSLGFRGQDPTALPSIDFSDDTIPDELLFRFSRPIVILPPPAGEFAERIGSIHADIGLPSPDGPELQRLVDDAIDSCRGNRWLENYSSDLLISQQLSPALKHPEIDPTLLF